MKLIFLILVALNALALASAVGWLGASAPRGEPERISNQLNPHLIMLDSERPQPSLVAPPNSSAPTTNTPAPPVRGSELTSTQQDKQPVVRTTEVPVSSTAQQLQQLVPTQTTADSQPQSIANSAASPTQATLPPRPTPSAPTPSAPTAAAVSPLACAAFDSVQEPIVDQIERIISSSNPAVRMSRTLIEPASGWWVRIPPAASRAAADQRAAELRQSGITDLFVVRENGPDQSAISLGLFRTESAARQHLSDLQRRRVTDATVTRRTPAQYRIELRGPANVLPTITRSLPSGAISPSDQACRP